MDDLNAPRQEVIADGVNVFIDDTIFILYNLAGFILLLAIGYVIGWLVKKLIVKLVESLRMDEWLEEQNLSSAIGGKTIASIIGSIVKWSIVALFLARAVKIFEFTAFQAKLEELVLEIVPAIIIAVVIGLIGLIIGRYVRNLIEVSMTKFRKVLGFSVEILIIYMAIVIALKLAGIPVDILIEAFRIGFGGIVLALVIAVGMSFGLASVEDAKKILKDIKKSKPK